MISSLSDTCVDCVASTIGVLLQRLWKNSREDAEGTPQLSHLRPESCSFQFVPDQVQRIRLEVSLLSQASCC